MFLGSLIFGLGMLWWFSALGYVAVPVSWGTMGRVGAIALVATVVEALPFKDIDNLTLTAVSLGLGGLLL
ncbi:MAG: phosphatidate cytidylyltransferase, partial [Cyanobacteria bacterium P01_A01_bin.135]